MAYSNLYASFFLNCQRAISALSFVWYFRPFRFYLAALLVLQAAAWWGAWFIYSRLIGDILVLHYTVDFGIDLIGAPNRVFFLPLFGSVVVIINFIFSLFLVKRRDFSTQAHLLFAGALIFCLFLNLAIFFLYLINFK